MDEAAYRRWLDGYKKAWEGLDVEAAVALFTSTATYRETPFTAPARGTEGIRAYWREALAQQQDVHFSYEILAVVGDTGYCHWSCSFALQDGARRDLDGIFRCGFDSADPLRCRQFEEWWHKRHVSPN